MREELYCCMMIHSTVIIHVNVQNLHVPKMPKSNKTVYKYYTVRYATTYTNKKNKEAQHVLDREGKASYKDYSIVDLKKLM